MSTPQYKYFIQCPHCEKMNSFSEFITFCDNCGKKLPANFPEWKKENPQGTASDFRDKYCIALSDDVDEYHHHSPPYKTYIILGFFFFLITAGVYLALNRPEHPGDLFLPKNTPEEILESEWTRNEYGKYGFSIKSPAKLVYEKPDLSAIAAGQLSDAEHYSYRPSRGFHLELSTLVFNQGYNVLLQNVVRSTINQLGAREGITNFEFNQSPVLFDELKGLLLEGSYTENKRRIRFMCVLCSRNEVVWQALATYRANDETGVKAAEKAIGSLEINYRVKPV